MKDKTEGFQTEQVPHRPNANWGLHMIKSLASPNPGPTDQEAPNVQPSTKESIYSIREAHTKAPTSIPKLQRALKPLTPSKLQPIPGLAQSCQQ